MIHRIYTVLFLVFLFNTSLAQVTENHQKTAIEIAKRYCELSSALAEANSKISLIDSIANLFISDTEVYDDTKDEEGMAGISIYLNNIFENRGKLRFTYINTPETAKMWYDTQHGYIYIILELKKNISRKNGLSTVVKNYLIVNVTGKVIDTISPFLPDGVIKTNNLVNVATASPTQIDSIYVNNHLIPMVHVQGGRFKMGCTDDQGIYCKQDEAIHEVELDDFRICNIEVSQGLYTSIMGRNPSKDTCIACPVDFFTWYDAILFCNKLSISAGLKPYYHIDENTPNPEYTGHFKGVNWTVKRLPEANGFRLPTEAQWEYAAKGGRRDIPSQYAGSDDLDEVSWEIDPSYYRLYPVALKSPNELSLFDMSGNVLEWCWDWYGEYDLTKIKNPSGPESGEERVNKGGYIGTHISSRDNLHPSMGWTCLGMRLVLPAK